MNIINKTLGFLNLRQLLGALALCAATVTPLQAQVSLADQPVFSSTTVPGNLVLALSVEFPTAVSVAHQGRFVAGTRYLAGGMKTVYI